MAEASPALAGVIPVLPTPFAEDGALDPGGLGRLIEHALGWGVSGIAVLGVASEAEKLTPEEYESVAALAGRAVAGRLPLVIGVSAGDPAGAARRAACAARAGAAAVFAKAPAPARPETAEAELREYFVAIADAARVPVMAQSFAVAGGGPGLLSLAALRRLVEEEPRIRYVKEETPPPEGNGKISRLREALGERVGIFSGSGGITLVDDLRRGAVGCMPGAVLAPGLRRVHELYGQGRAEEADRLHAALLPLILFRARWGSVTVTKAILRDAGILGSARVRPPADGHLDAPACAELRRLVAERRAWL